MIEKTRTNYDEERIARAMVFSNNNPSVFNELLNLDVRLTDPMYSIVQKAFEKCVADGWTDINAIVSNFVDLGGNEIQMLEQLDDDRFTVSFVDEITKTVDRLNRDGRSAEYRQSVFEYAAGEISHAEMMEKIKLDVPENDSDIWTLDDVRMAVENHDPSNIVEIGFDEFDGFHGGMERGRVTILAARPGIGKSDLAMHTIRHNLKQGKNVVFVSIEMDKREIGYRIGRAENTAKYGKAGTLNGIDAIRDWPGKLTILGMADASAGLISSRVKDDTDLVVVDYLQIMKAVNNTNSYEMTTELSNDVRKAAKRSKAAWLVLSQLNRDAGNTKTKPTLINLRGSGAIEQDAYAVLFLHSPTGDSNNGADQQLTLSVEKNRGGPRGEIEVIFDKINSRWRQL